MSHLEEIATRLVKQWINDNIVFVCGDYAYRSNDLQPFKTLSDLRAVVDKDMMFGIGSQVHERKLYSCHERPFLDEKDLGILSYQVGVLKPRIEEKRLFEVVK